MRQGWACWKAIEQLHATNSAAVWATGGKCGETAAAVQPGWQWHTPLFTMRDGSRTRAPPGKRERALLQLQGGTPLTCLMLSPPPPPLPPCCRCA